MERNERSSVLSKSGGFASMKRVIQKAWSAAEKMPPACCGIRLDRYLRNRNKSLSGVGSAWGVKM